MNTLPCLDVDFVLVYMCETFFEFSFRVSFFFQIKANIQITAGGVSCINKYCYLMIHAYF